MPMIYIPVWLLAAFPPLFWAGNFVLARALHADLPPLTLAFWRWTLALVILLPFGLPALWRQRTLLARHWRLLTALALLGVTGYNTMLYIGLQDTTATNALLLSSATPVLIVALSFVVLRHRPRLLALLGLALSLAGVWLIVSAGEPARLLDLGLRSGDAWILATTLDWAIYSVLLRLRPAGLDPAGFLTALVALGLPPLAGLYAWELQQGIGLTLNAANLAAIGYVALFPSVLAYLFWNRAVAELGANRTGQYMHLVPVFGILLGVLVLGERLQWFHAAGAALIAGGIVLSAQRSKRV
ncbi:MAG: EamA family transporter [Gammaproteobacteria bacterium]|nr:EamA family transporter [Gammaproteobacteria bacterium]